MLRFLVRWLLQLIPTLFLVTCIVFLLVHFIPGDPVLVMLGVDEEVGATFTEEQYLEVQRQLGLDQPVFIRYIKWLNRIIHGDFGLSLRVRRPVAELLVERYPPTVYLALSSVAIALMIAIPAGITAAVRQNTFVDYACMGFAMWGVAIPNFWLALMLTFLFSLKLGLFPSMGYVDPLDSPLLFLRHVFTPSIVLGTSLAASLTRYLRAEMLEQLNQDYVRTARAKGLPPLMVIVKHTARNSLIAMVTVVGLDIARLLGGTVIVELIFGWPGIGSLLIEGIYARDYPVVQGTVLFLALTYVVINLLVDITYKWFDPRIRTG